MLTTNKRIAKNTLFLYIRMFIMMGVSLYTSRVVLQKLGVDDFGLYNIVGGVVVMFSVFNSSLAGSTQRFLNYEMGRDDVSAVNHVFQCSIMLHVILCVILIILAETIGLWYINTYLNVELHSTFSALGRASKLSLLSLNENVPLGRYDAARIVYQLSVLTFCINVLRVPFNACIIAHEKMDFYAYVSVAEAVLKLLVAFMLTMCDFDRLIFYSFLILLVTVLVNISYVIYCTKTFPHIKTKLLWDKEKIKGMLSFSGWSLFGSAAVISAQHGINLIFNFFCGVGLNAAAGIAHQVTSAMYGFISNFQTAFNPQIVKLYAQKQFNDYFSLIFRASKFSFLLFWLISVPVFLYAPILLDYWLDEVPPHAVSFCRVIIIFLLIDALNGPLWTAVNATGKIRIYHILMSGIILCNIPVAILLLWFGLEPELVWFSKIIFNIIAMIVRWVYLRRIVGFPCRKYIANVIIPLSMVVFLSIVPLSILYLSSVDIHISIGILFSLLYILFVSYIFGLNKQEKFKIKKCLCKNAAEF